MFPTSVNLQPPPPRQLLYKKDRNAKRLQDLFPMVHENKPSHENKLTLEETPEYEPISPPSEYKCIPIPNFPSTSGVNEPAVPYQEDSDHIQTFELTPKFIQDHINGDI